MGEFGEGPDQFADRTRAAEPQDAVNPRPGRARRALLATVAAVTALGAAVGFGYSMKDGPQGPVVNPDKIGAPAAPNPEQSVLAQKEQEVRGNMQVTAVRTAQSILEGLASRNSRVETYENGRAVGNKTSITGADGKVGTPDDKASSDVPEVFARYNPKNGTIVVSSTLMEGGGDDAKFTSADFAFKTVKNPDQNNDGTLDVGDFKSAISAPETKFIGGDLANQWGYNEVTKGTFGERFGVFLGPNSIITGSEPKGSPSLTAKAIIGEVPDTNANSALTVASSSVDSLDTADRVFQSTANNVGAKIAGALSR